MSSDELQSNNTRRQTRSTKRDEEAMISTSSKPGLTITVTNLRPGWKVIDQQSSIDKGGNSTI